MAETKRKAGRPKKEEKPIENTNNNNDDLVKQLLEQVNNLQMEIQKQKEENAKANSEKSDLQELVEVLKQNQTEPKKELPNKVKVVSLIENQLNLPVPNSNRVYTFAKFGHTNIIKLQDLEDIMGNARFREQAERGYFYICDNDIVEELGLDEEYKTLNDEHTMRLVRELKGDDCVDLFCGLDKSMQESLATKIAEEMANNKPFDLNVVDAIYRRTDIDIKKLSDDIRDGRKRLEAKESKD